MFHDRFDWKVLSIRMNCGSNRGPIPIGLRYIRPLRCRRAAVRFHLHGNMMRAIVTLRWSCQTGILSPSHFCNG